MPVDLGLASPLSVCYNPNVMRQSETETRAEGGGWKLSQILHLPDGKTYYDFLFDDTAYWMIDSVKNECEVQGRGPKEAA